MAKKEYTAIGLMSGTSLDGLDVVLCRLRLRSGGWHFEILDAATTTYDDGLKRALDGSAGDISGLDLVKLHKSYGRFLATACRDCMSRNNIPVDFIASHGHTVHHRPEEGINFQLGDANEIAALCGVPVVYDFRSLDIALGGQGAPLVPAGDELLFGSYAACVNLGGFANISYDSEGRRIAFDVSPCNIVLNRLAGREGLALDKDGLMAATAEPDGDLLAALNDLPYYRKPPPKSLGREWFEEVFLPVIEQPGSATAVLLRTVCEHIAVQVGKALRAATEGRNGEVLVTGGGAMNKFLMGRIADVYGKGIPPASPDLVAYKEALVFAFLGLLRMLNQVNCLNTATGARAPSSSGSIVNHVPARPAGGQ